MVQVLHILSSSKAPKLQAPKLLQMFNFHPALLHEGQSQVGVLHDIILLELDVVFLHEVKSSFEKLFGTESLCQRQHSLSILTVQIVYDAVSQFVV